METVYLDHSATTPVHPEVLGAMMTYFAHHFGNASSIHREGRLARQAIEEARAQVAALIGADAAEIVFTGGGTEADNLAILGAAFAEERGRNHLITSAIEHHAVENACRHLRKRGFEVTVLPVDGQGRVSPEAVGKAVTDKTLLISIMHANNEIGTVEPLREIGVIARAKGILLHSDAVQSAGKIPVFVDELGVDLLSLAGHKIYGPKGTGALYVRRGTALQPITFGGHQEWGLRNGTENVPGVVGLGKACQIAARDLNTQRVHLEGLRDLLAARIREEIPDAHVNGHPTERLPHLLSVSFYGVSGEMLVRELDLRGVAVSAGSACTAGSTNISPVLAALGMEEALAVGTLRFSMGRGNTPDEILRTAALLGKLVRRHRGLPQASDASARGDGR